MVISTQLDISTQSSIYLLIYLYLHSPLSIYIISTQEVTSAPSSPLTLAKTPDSVLRSSEMRPGGGGARWGYYSRSEYIHP